MVVSRSLYVYCVNGTENMLESGWQPLSYTLVDSSVVATGIAELTFS